MEVVAVNNLFLSWCVDDANSYSFLGPVVDRLLWRIAANKSIYGTNVVGNDLWSLTISTTTRFSEVHLAFVLSGCYFANCLVPGGLPTRQFLLCKAEIIAWYLSCPNRNNAEGVLHFFLNSQAWMSIFKWLSTRNQPCFIYRLVGKLIKS